MDILSSMNHPDGDCPLCLYPLVREDKNASALPFMKLMSCFHCFHRLIPFHFSFLFTVSSSNALTDVLSISCFTVNALLGGGDGSKRKVVPTKLKSLLLLQETREVIFLFCHVTSNFSCFALQCVKPFTVDPPLGT